MTASDFPIVTKRQRLFESRVFTVEAMNLTFKNGTQRVFERLCMRGEGAVLVIPFIDDDQFYVIREYAAGIENYVLGFVKGIIDPGENATEAAKRELREEIGFDAKQVKFIRTILPSPGYMTHKLHIMLAWGLHEAPLCGDEPEPLGLHTARLSEMDQLIAEKTFCDARCIAALFLIRDYLKSEKPMNQGES